MRRYAGKKFDRNTAKQVKKREDELRQAHSRQLWYVDDQSTLPAHLKEYVNNFAENEINWIREDCNKSPCGPAVAQLKKIYDLLEIKADKW